jgi:VanZ family protein
MPMRPIVREARVWLPPLAMMLLIFALSSMSAGNEHHGELYVVSRKVAHFCEYALLLALWWRALTTKVSDHRALALALGIVLLYSISDELHQTLVTGRHGRPLDVGIDMTGALAASAVIMLKRPRRRVKA